MAGVLLGSVISLLPSLKLTMLLDDGGQIKNLRMGR